MNQTPDLPPPPDPWRVIRPLLAVITVAIVATGIVSVARDLGERVGAGIEASEESDAVVLEPGLEVDVEIPSGASAEEIGELLEGEGLVTSAAQFEAAVRAANVDSLLQSGSYTLLSGMSIQEIIDELRAGPRVVVFDVTVREGLRVTEIIDVLAEASGIPVPLFTAALEGGLVTTAVVEFEEDVQVADWEGLLFPDTYRFSEDATAADMLQRLSNTMSQRLDSVDWSAFEAAGFTQYEGIIIASLIESEVRVADERPLVSAVIRNRLDDGERLDIDATVLYAQGTRDPSEIDITIDSPYNTRLVGGLPPGPISSPGLASLEAAAEPAEVEFRYYVLAADDGSHAFAETLDEHNSNVAAAREAGIIP